MEDIIMKDIEHWREHYTEIAKPDPLVLRSRLLLLLEARHPPPQGAPGLLPFPELREKSARSAPKRTHPTKTREVATQPFFMSDVVLLL